MRVALNVNILQAPRTGIGEYVLQLGSQLQEQHLQLELFDGWRWRDDFPSASQPGYNRLSRLLKTFVPHAYAVRRQLLQQCFSRGVRELQPDVYHEPSLWPLEFDGPMLMTLHDLTHVHYPDTQPSDRLREIERRLPDALQRASRIMVDSQFIADEASRYYGLPAEKLQVAPLGHASRFHPRPANQLQQRLQSMSLQLRSYFLSIGTLEPRKNLELTIAAYLQLPKSLRQRVPLLIIGMQGWRPEQLRGALRQAANDPQIRLLGYQDENVVAELLAGARALVFPSRYEGFGLPALEAMASGTPLILGRCAALPEVAGAAALYVDPDDDSGCSQAMQQLIDDPVLWERLRADGLQRAEQFSWARCASITAHTYRMVSKL